MRSSRAVSFRALSVLAIALAGVMLVSGISPGATKFLTKQRAKKLFYTKAQADARFEGQADWALIRPDGTIIDQSGGISVQDHSLTGAYYLHFPVAVQGRAIVATHQNDPGEITATACGGVPIGIDCSKGTNTVNDAVVVTRDSAGSPANHDFYIAVLP